MRPRITRTLALVASLSATLVARQGTSTQTRTDEAGQQPPVTFKLEVDYVEVDAIVTDERGNFVPGLKREDFQVLEEGKPQDIAAFSLVNIPIERADRPLFASQPIEPDVRSNARPFAGRVFVLLMDDLHTHFARAHLVKAAAKQFVERYVGANDLAAVVHVRGAGQANQDFTNSRVRLLASIDRFVGHKLRSTTLEKLDEEARTRDQRQRDERINDPLDAERGFRARQTLDTLEAVSQALAGIRGRRKALVLFSEGIDYDILDVFGAREATTIVTETRDAIAAATRANVSIFAVDPRGVTGFGDELVEIGSLPEDTSLRLGPESVLDEVRRAQDSLRVLSEQTGGFAVLNQNDFRSGFARILQDNSSYYVLGYYAQNPRRGGFRKIEVKVNRPGLQVRARRGYVAAGREADRKPVSGISPELFEAISNPVPQSGLRIAASAVPFRGTGSEASVLVLVQVDGSGLKLEERAGVFQDSVEVTTMAIDPNGKTYGDAPGRLDFKLKPDTARAIAARGFSVTERLSLKPGRYQLRVAAREIGAGRTGSVLYDLDVPDFSKERLSMSGLLITSPSTAAVRTAKPDDQLKAALPGPPTTARTFPRNETLALYADIYDNATDPHKVDVTTTVVTDEGREVVKLADQRDIAELKGARGAFGHSVQVPLSGLAPGRYVLRVTATSRISGGASTAREVQFEIR